MRNNILAITMLFFITSSARAATPEEVLNKSINQSNLLPPQSSAEIKLFPRETLVSVYSQSALADQKSLKISALKAARVVYDSDKSIASTKVRFFDKERKTFKQVVITQGDADAYGTDEAENLKLLDALDLSVGALNDDGEELDSAHSAEIEKGEQLRKDDMDHILKPVTLPKKPRSTY